MAKKYVKPEEFTTLELMAVCGSKQIKNGEVVFIGTGLPLIAAMLAKKTHAPGAKIVYEAGFIDSNAKDIALSIADSRLGYHAAGAIGLIETLGLMLQGGHVDLGFVGAAQIDEYGNINTTYIGSFEKPVVRLPGSGGGNDIISSAKRVVVIMTHEKRKMVKKLDYLTSPGFLDGPGARERTGLLGGGPSLVVTNLCQMDFDPKTKRIRLATVHPGVSVQQVVDNSGFDLIIPQNVPTTELPTYEELELLRAIDPKGIYIPRSK
ncbi:3-oxoadipate--succinyl-CoA transferase subunit B [Candidatus Bathyarchaeota archaeon]|jgi:glutaconate CoA-transferase subunit B|nr:3-oxoadipate--succinyl-CoA transferase subunit B [Candidatus Bathyarchaeota archaeon]